MDKHLILAYFYTVGTTDISNILNKHCRFRFRGGKEAFGVIWEAGGALVFTSKVKHNSLHLSGRAIDISELLRIDRNDVMIAEVIA